MMTEGDKRYIINHTKKSLEEYYNNKGTSMKPTKTKPAKRNDNPIIGKLLKLKYRINDTYRNTNDDTLIDDTRADKKYVMTLINDIRKHKFETLSPEDGHCCNGLWRKYEGK